MRRFYVNQEQIKEDTITITGPDVNHIKNVLRMKQGEEIVICNGQGKDCYCIIIKVSDTEILAGIQAIKDTETELPAKLILFQGLPKMDKMELIIQKAVELGVYEIVPVMTARCVVRLEDKKKEEKKLERWQAIAESAAKQSGRGHIPRVAPVLSFKEAVKSASGMDLAVIPYENASGIQLTKNIIAGLKKNTTVGILIGPEGGFEESEIALAESGHITPITLGRRILRTETAGFALLSMMMLALEE
jgi:16S rRNA (uracil1498-N3)-methyltransferase